MSPSNSRETNGNHTPISLDIKDSGDSITKDKYEEPSDSLVTVPFAQKLIAELIGTYFLIFAGCASIVVNTDEAGIVTFPGVAIVWGLVLMVMIYSVGHISGAHFNPAVTIAFATCKRFEWKQVPAYVSAQLLASILASGTLRLIFNGHQDCFAGSLPSGSTGQAFALEFIITFLLMFVISGVATDSRAVGELAGLAIGATLTLNAFIAGPVSGASMNPARSLGPSIVSNNYTDIWVYMSAPILGAIAGAWVYNLIRFTDKPLREITKSASFMKSVNRSDSV